MLTRARAQLGGGCELALMCDIILASPSATFGQPEINLGVIPGGGGTQRLALAVGKSRAMELTLTGRNFSAAEAAAWGVVSRVVEDGSVVDEAVKMAGVIASKGRLAVQAGKEAVNTAYEQTLSEGLRTERRLFHGLFATQDQKEGTCDRLTLKAKILTCALRYGGICGEEEAGLETRVSAHVQYCTNTMYTISRKQTVTQASSRAHATPPLHATPSS